LKGAIIEDVVKGGPADRAGLRPTRVDLFGRLLLGDVITSVDQQPVDSANDFLDIIEQKKTTEQAFLTILRGRTKGQVKVAVVEER
jgi:S1-C subfamily serine protease